MKKNQSLPKVSVIMPVYNGEKFLRDAIDSILAQTFKDFELILINDGSSDSSADIIASYDDPRIVFVDNQANTGLPRVRNQGLDVSRGEYIAWLDCDDLSLPERLEKQVKLLDENPRVGVCGAWMKIIGGAQDEIVQHPTNPEFIRAKMLFNNCLANSTIMMRAACTREINLRFDLSQHLSQDYGLWISIPRQWQIVNIPQVLTLYRFHPGQVTARYPQMQIDITWQIQKQQLSGLGISPTAGEKIIHMSLSGFIQDTFKNPGQVLEARNYLIKLYRANKKRKIYTRKAFRDVLLEKWGGVAQGLGASVWLTSYWMIFKFDIISYDLLWRAIKKFVRVLVKSLKKRP